MTETPVFLTSTMQVGRVYDAACRLLMDEQPEIADSVVIPVVGRTTRGSTIRARCM